MEIILMRNDSDRNVLYKDIEVIDTLDVKLRKDFNIFSPVIYLTNFSKECNYVYIPFLNRYYFVTNIVNTHAKINRIELTTDVLMSFKNVVLDTTIQVNRTDNPNYYNGSLDYDCRTEVNRFVSDVALEKGSLTILATVGG